MIVYSLRCKDGHKFEGWFGSSAAYDEQAAGGKLVCPVCDSHRIEKAIMAPAVSGTGKSAQPMDEIRKMRTFMTGMRKYVLEHGENVGRAFPEEARKIHYGETEDRQIYGEASLEEVKDLVEEGVDVAPLPPDLDEKAN
jgi:hypothetical protein